MYLIKNPIFGPKNIFKNFEAVFGIWYYLQNKIKKKLRVVTSRPILTFKLTVCCSENPIIDTCIYLSLKVVLGYQIWGLTSITNTKTYD
jgi:hypothetical protein